MRVWFRLICPLKKTVLFHSMTAFVFHIEKFSPHKPIPRHAFMGENIGFPSGDSQVRPKSTLSNLRDTTSIHFTFIWEDPLPQGCLAHDHTQRVWYQKYLVNQSREGFPVTMDEKKRIVFKIKLVAEPLKVRTQPRSLYLDNPLSLVALGTGSVLFRTALWYCFGA